MDKAYLHPPLTSRDMITLVGRCCRDVEWRDSVITFPTPTLSRAVRTEVGLKDDSDCSALYVVNLRDPLHTSRFQCARQPQDDSDGVPNCSWIAFF